MHESRDSYLATSWIDMPNQGLNDYYVINVIHMSDTRFYHVHAISFSGSSVVLNTTHRSSLSNLQLPISNLSLNPFILKSPSETSTVSRDCYIYKTYYWVLGVHMNIHSNWYNPALGSTDNSYEDESLEPNNSVVFPFSILIPPPRTKRYIMFSCVLIYLLFFFLNGDEILCITKISNRK